VCHANQANRNDGHDRIAINGRSVDDIYPGHALGSHCTAGPVCGGNGGNAGTGINGGTCITNSCNANGGSGNGGTGQNANGGQGQNGVIGAGAIPCVDGHRTLTSSDGRTVTQAC